jgi:Rieske 2Fe-2S family protein
VGPAGFDPAYAADFWDLVNRQDWAACESVQRNARLARLAPGPVLPLGVDVHAVMSAVAHGYETGPPLGQSRMIASTNRAGP